MLCRLKEILSEALSAGNESSCGTTGKLTSILGPEPPAELVMRLMDRLILGEEVGRHGPSYPGLVMPIGGGPMYQCLPICNACI